MAGTRNKQMPCDFYKYQQEVKKQSEWNTLIQTPAYPCSGINVQYVPSTALSSNAVDIETFLYGIGSNNYIFPSETPTYQPEPMQTVSFIPQKNVYLPILPPMLQHQRP